MNGESKEKYLILGIGKITPLWVIFALISLMMIAFGIWGYAQQLIHGEIVTGLRSLGVGGVGWGLYIVFDIYFTGISFAGIMTSALVRIFGIKELKPLTRPAELLTIITLILGAMTVLADQGRVLHALWYLPQYARVMSPMFGTFTMVISGYLFASLVYFYLSGREDAWRMSNERSKGFLRIFFKIWAMGFNGRPDDYLRHHTTSFWLAIFIIPMLVIAYSTLGFIFGIQAGRPGWFSALQAPGFAVMAGVSGIGMLIIIAYLLRKIYKLEDVINERTFRTLGLMLMILTITYIYFMIVEELTANYAAPKKDREVAHAIVFGPYAPYFWTTVATLLISAIILFYQFVSGKVKILPTVISGFLVNIAAFCKRFIIVVPSQTHGLLLPYQEGHYSPTIVEIAVVVGLFGLGILAYITFAKIFPLIPLDTLSSTYKAEITKSEELKFSRILRVSLSIFTLLLGVSLMVVGFLSSARFWTEYYSDPVIPFAPVVFILGVILSFTSAILYEVLPGKYKTSSSHQTA